MNSRAPEYVPIGKIVRAHGLKGAVKVYPYSDSGDAFQMRKSLLAVGVDGKEATLAVRWVRTGNRVLHVALADVESREQAEALIGAELFIERSALPPLEAGTYYWIDILGLDVVTETGEHVGKVAEIIPTGGNDVYVVKNGERETLIPALDWVVLSIDPGKRLMRVNLPDGL